MERTAPRWPETVTAALGALWLGLFPLWNDLSYAHITRAKWLAALVLCGVTVAACAAVLITLACKGQLRTAVRRHPAQLIALCQFLGIQALRRLGLCSQFVDSSNNFLHIHSFYTSNIAIDDNTDAAFLGLTAYTS